MYSIDMVNRIRAWELDHIARHFRPGTTILEIGAGSGQQAFNLSKRGFDIKAIDIPASEHGSSRVFPIIDYDGLNIPFPDGSFDYIFSSNVLEHVPNLTRMHAEIARVLKPDGRVVHVLPTHGWRLWTTLSRFLVAAQHVRTLQPEMLLRRPMTRSELRRFRKAWGMIRERICEPFTQHRHGARGNVISETWLFHPNFWRRNFSENGFVIEHEAPVGLFYTGNLVFGRRLTMTARARLAKYLGSACHLFVLKSASAYPSAD